MSKVHNVPERTSRLLDTKVQAARPNMTPTKEVLYANDKTGTVVYRVLTSNSTLPSRMKGGSPLRAFESITWGSFLVGNDRGYLGSDIYVHSEANFHLGEIIEDDEKVTIPRSGTKTMHFGIQIAVGDLVFTKAKFLPYGRKRATA